MKIIKIKSMQALKLNATNLLIIILLGFSECNDNMHQNIETSKIISVLIDRIAKPIPPPPPAGLSDSLFRIKSDSIKKVTELDEWKNQKFIVALDTLLKPLSSDIDDSIEQYGELIEKLNKLTNTQFLDIDRILEPRGVTLRPVILDASGRTDYRNINMYLCVSNIAFNDNKSSAVLVLGVSRGRLNGYTSILGLKKINGKWKIMAEKILVIN